MRRIQKKFRNLAGLKATIDVSVEPISEDEEEEEPKKKKRKKQTKKKIEKQVNGFIFHLLFLIFRNFWPIFLNIRNFDFP